MANKLGLIYIDRKSVRGRISFDKVIGMFSAYIVFFCEMLLAQSAVYEDKSKTNFICEKILSEYYM